MAFQIVNDNLNKPAQNNPNKTIAEAFTDGTISKEDLQVLNRSTAFPANDRNWRGLADGEYSTADAMKQFTNLVVPHMSDQALYNITHRLVEIEVNSNMTQAFRTSTLAKAFVIAELERHKASVGPGQLPATFLSHMKTYILPLCKAQWPEKLEENVNTFARFNMSPSLMSPEALAKFQGVDAYPQINAFDNEKFNPSNLSNEPKNTAKDFLLQQANTVPVSWGQKISSAISSFSGLFQAGDTPTEISKPSTFRNQTEGFKPAAASASIETLHEIDEKKLALQEQYSLYKNVIKDINQSLIDNPNIREQDPKAFDGATAFISLMMDRLGQMHSQIEQLNEKYKALAEKISSQKPKTP